MKYYWLKKWKKKLGITDEIRFEYIPREQIICAYNRPYHLVGISGNTIYHDRRLREEDIVHELIHHKYKYRTETWVRKKTRELCEENTVV